MSEHQTTSKFANRAEFMVYWTAKHWLAGINLLIFVYIGLPIAAPALMKVGWTSAANAIYTIYAPLCHQLAFRSWFLFGEKMVYPLDEFIQRMGLSESSTNAQFNHARSFIGNETMGWKIALCQRDVAIYLGLLLAGLIFVYLRRQHKVQAMPFWLFVLLGIVPIGLDGGSQFVSLVVSSLPSRESVWQMRALTGALFGFSIIWLTFPYLQESMDEVIQQFESRWQRPKPHSTRDKVIDILEKQGAIPQDIGDKHT